MGFRSSNWRRGIRVTKHAGGSTWFLLACYRYADGDDFNESVKDAGYAKFARLAPRPLSTTNCAFRCPPVPLIRVLPDE